MKALITLLFCFSFNLQTFSQIPDLQVQDVMENFFNLPDYLEDDKNYGLIIWSVEDPPSLAALDDYDNYYTDWVNDYNIEFLTISIDEEVSQEDVINYVNQQDWEYTLLFSTFPEVMEAFGIIEIPYIYLINMSQEIVFEIAGWLQGDLLEEEISELFTLGMEEQSALGSLNVYAIEENIIVDMEKIPSYLKISLYSVDGGLIIQNTFFKHASNRLTLNTRTISSGSFVIIKIENEKGDYVSRKVMIR